MEKSIRKLATELNGFVMSRLTAPRKNLCVPISIRLDQDENSRSESLSISGETKDLSKSGIAFYAPCIRICEKYLIGEDRKLYAELDAPNGKIKIQLIAVRYEQIGIHDSTAKFVIGARIEQISETDRILYQEYLKYGDALRGAEQKDLTVETAPEG